MFKRPAPKPEELPLCRVCSRAAPFTEKNTERPTEPPAHYCRDHIPDTSGWAFMKKTDFRFFEEAVLENASTALGASPAVDQNPFA
jgi:hypothetical protein